MLPLAGLLARTPWPNLGSLLTGEVVTDALGLSLLTSLAATAIAAVVGVPLAWLLARTDFPGRTLARGLVTLPLVLPPVVGGAALLFAFGRRGLFGQPLNEATGLLLPFSIWGVILANTFVATPFLVITVEGALRQPRPALRRCGRNPRGESVDAYTAGDVADDRALIGRWVGSDLGPRSR